MQMNSFNRFSLNKTQIWSPYFKIGRTNLSNKSGWSFIDTFVNLYKYLFSLNMAFKALPDNVICASEKEPPTVKTMPKYDNVFTI